ncbi:MAG TPA: hypothetical protein VNW92_25100, partial [Polyangiaceae bacterium]|nr:hypothetical protein [Polyangiaceae bacterium]
KFEVPLSSVDAVVILQRRCDPKPDDHLWSAAHPLADEVLSLQTYVTLLHVQALRRYDDSRGETGGKFREHFGFLDGFSQPEVVDVALLPDGENQVARGEILLGHPNDSGEIPGDGNPLLTNGSFLVLRKLSQDVASFRSVVGDATCPMAAKMVGRTSEGAPLVNTELGPTGDWFNFARDEAGLKCPLQSHARLANPRAPEGRSAYGRRARTPRIMRRGFSYGPRYEGNENAERGLLFMAYNASIAQQYEVVQRWLNGGNSTGLDSSQRDPLSGAVDTPASGTNGGKLFRYRDGNTVKTVPLPPTPFAKLEWGMYLFVPSLSGFGVLAEQLQHQLAIEKAQAEGNGAALTLDEQEGLGIGQELLARLLASEDVNDWKMLLEEQGAGQSKQSFKVLAAIRANHRVLRSPVGVLVVGASEVLEVLTQEERFSVREYWRRMRESTMEMYLGMDARPVPKAVCPMSGASGRRRDQDYVDSIGTKINYERESIANAYIARISRVDGFLAAFHATDDALKASVQIEKDTAASILESLPKEQSAAAMAKAATTPLRVAVDLSLLAQQVISGLSQFWFALPDGDHMRKSGEPSRPSDPAAYCPLDFGVFSEYVFRPAPDEMTEGLAALRGARVTQVTADFVAATYAREGGGFRHEFLNHLQGAASRLALSEPETQGLIVRSVVGTVDGFVAATYGSFLSVMGQWLADGETLWRVQKDHETILAPALLAALEARAEQEAATGPASGEPPESIANGAAFVRKVTDTLKNFPKPAWLHRVAMSDTDLGSVHIKAGDRVVVHLGQAALEQPGSPELLFGGPYDPVAKTLTSAERTPLHACPAREMALGVLLGMLVAVLKRKNLRYQTTLAITFEDLPEPSGSPGAAFARA